MKSEIHFSTVFDGVGIKMSKLRRSKKSNYRNNRARLSWVGLKCRWKLIILERLYNEVDAGSTLVGIFCEQWPMKIKLACRTKKLIQSWRMYRKSAAGTPSSRWIIRKLFLNIFGLRWESEKGERIGEKQRERIGKKKALCHFHKTVWRIYKIDKWRKY